MGTAESDPNATTSEMSAIRPDLLLARRDIGGLFERTLTVTYSMRPNLHSTASRRARVEHVLIFLMWDNAFPSVHRLDRIDSCSEICQPLDEPDSVGSMVKPILTEHKFTFNHRVCRYAIVPGAIK